MAPWMSAGLAAPAASQCANRAAFTRAAGRDGDVAATAAGDDPGDRAASGWLLPVRLQPVTVTAARTEIVTAIPAACRPPIPDPQIAT